MKASKKIARKLDRRTESFDRNLSKYNESGKRAFTRPGSRNGRKGKG